MGLTVAVGSITLVAGSHHRSCDNCDDQRSAVLRGLLRLGRLLLLHESWLFLSDSFFCGHDLSPVVLANQRLADRSGQAGLGYEKVVGGVNLSGLCRSQGRLRVS